MNKVDDIKPTIFSIQANKGVFGSSTNTYNQAGVTYNQAGAIYGGGDTVTAIGPSIASFLNTLPSPNYTLTVKPSLNGGRTMGVFGTTNTTYNEAGIAYDQALQVYGGGDFLGDIGPHIANFGIIDSAMPAPPSGQAGLPYGLLLTLTQPN